MDTIRVPAGLLLIAFACRASQSEGNKGSAASLTANVPRQFYEINRPKPFDACPWCDLVNHHLTDGFVAAPGPPRQQKQPPAQRNLLIDPLSQHKADHL